MYVWPWIDALEQQWWKWRVSAAGWPLKTSPLVKWWVLHPTQTGRHILAHSFFIKDRWDFFGVLIIVLLFTLMHPYVSGAVSFHVNQTCVRFYPCFLQLMWCIFLTQCQMVITGCIHRVSTARAPCVPDTSTQSMYCIKCVHISQDRFLQPEKPHNLFKKSYIPFLKIQLM